MERKCILKYDVVNEAQCLRRGEKHMHVSTLIVDH